jgi:glycosyltransferase involved in cell wall biosynthesis
MKVGVYIGQHRPEMGGVYIFERELLKALVNIAGKSRHDFVVVSWDKEPPEEIAAIGRIQFLSLANSVRGRLMSFLKYVASRHAVVKNMVTRKAERFVLNELLSDNIDILWLIANECPVLDLPYIATVFDLQHRVRPYFPEVSAEDLWSRRERYYTTKLRRASFVITGTEEGKKEVEFFYQVPPERVKVLPFPKTGTSLSAVPPRNDEEILKKYNLPNDYLFYPAQFWPHKNHMGLLMALKLLKDKHRIIVPVVFVGSDKGNLRFIKNAVNELNLTEQVYFLGFIPRDELIVLYRNALALAFLTFFGPDNLPPLEAFELGCPVIASNVSGSEEQLGDAALLVDPKDEQQIALAIKSLYDTPALRQRFIKHGHMRASQWTGADYIKGVLAILDEFEAIRRCWSSKERHG